MAKSKPEIKPANNWRNRITALEQHRPADLLDHPHQWRAHPKPQVDALRGILGEVGIAGALIAYHSERAGGKLVKIDGHARAGLGDNSWPVLVLDVDDREADLLLATYDPLSALAQADKVQLDGLLREVQSGDAAVQAMLADLAKDAGVIPADDDWGAVLGGLATGDKVPFQQMTFTLADAQAERVKEALAQAKAQGPFEDTSNENSNGNALARICEAYLD